MKVGKSGRVRVAALEAAPDALARRCRGATWRTREPAPAWRKPPAAARAGPVCTTRERAASGHTLAVTSWRRRMHPLAGAALASRPPPPADPLAPCLPAARGGGGTGVGADGRGWRGVSGSCMQLSLPAAFLLDEWDSDLAGLPSLSLMRDASRLCSQVRVHVELVARPAARVLVLAHAVARPLALGVHVHIRSHACALAHWAGAPHALRRGVRGRSVARVVPWCH